MPLQPNQCQLVAIFAANVRRRRIELGFSQEELAERAGVHRTYVGMLERSEKNATLQSIERLAIALEVEPAVLLTTPGSP
ncbi:helix-turn-helix transcriptional regulator [Metapseudomonas lalkuanensis]|uniref:Helix-turn-helix transcriptional regulator n=1 Tax=Metapseudomonas lalkuanensis TaxID=2604832 RepID=A0A5J6QR46_9GAMM|nr:helix-turn-helix transcriptional regulator [Pseudomonas lalkuanensis]QEY64963.1 helix-turn-helix transcriptional regulator [Pseudomonas lalkuanensis]